jgi:hypothetical protein
MCEQVKGMYAEQDLLTLGRPFFVLFLKVGAGAMHAAVRG